jgi:hypothetical protein
MRPHLNKGNKGNCNFIRTALVKIVVFLLALTFVSLSLLSIQFLRIVLSPKMPASPFIVVAPTFYASTDASKDNRYALGLECCRKAAEHGVRLIFVDASHQHQVVCKAMVKEGTDSQGRMWVSVVPQTAEGKKGAALKEAIEVARKELAANFPSVAEQDTFIAFQEPEKVDMISFWKDITNHMQTTQSEIVVPRRDDNLFRQTYPIEQYHSENFANLYLDSLGKAVGFPSVDWTMGPIIFRTSLASYWLEYTEGDLWDVQIVPMIRAWRHLQSQKRDDKGNEVHVSSYNVNFHHPASMKQGEEGLSTWSEKRLFQLNVLFEKVGGELKKLSQLMSQTQAAQQIA